MWHETETYLRRVQPTPASIEVITVIGRQNDGGSESVSSRREPWFDGKSSGLRSSLRNRWTRPQCQPRST
ncbi:hypothetical protein BIW11_02413 [Tropilaelaps mercedesae]|uniref:Uncharacterized protein n=1 Tax=Tropilaelaps mercedesae TaxID=418985 RepID=A0A1V9Y3N6_9ACAR|nr:hypothetical protein BIW11_02413 [Tropilaelaps mercedesae]